MTSLSDAYVRSKEEEKFVNASTSFWIEEVNVFNELISVLVKLLIVLTIELDKTVNSLSDA